MKNILIKNLAFLVFLNLLVKPFWILGIDRTVQNTLGPEIYGQYYALFSFTMLFQVLLDMGIANFNTRNISRHSQLLSKYLPSFIIVKMLFSLVYIIITSAIALSLGYDSALYPMIGLLGLNQIFHSAIQFNRSNLSGLHLFRTDSIFSVLDKMFMIIICSLLLWGSVIDGAFNIMWFIYAQTAALFTSFIASGIIVLSKTSTFKFKFKYHFILMILKQSYPFALLGILMILYTRMDTVMLERLLENGAEQAGIYASAYRLLESCVMYSLLFSSFLLPIFSRMLKNNEDTESLTTFSFKMVVVPALILCICSFFYRNNIMDLLYVNANSIYYEVFGLLFFSLIPMSAGFIYGTLITARGNMKILNQMSFAGLLLNFCLNIILILTLKNALAACISTIITQFLIMFTQLFYVNKLFGWRPEFKTIIRLCLLISLCISITWTIHLYINSWILGFCLSIMISSVLGFLLRMIDLSALSILLSSKQ